MMTRVINFFAGPSAGKTTNALGLASYLKTRRKDILYIPEFAMQAVVQGRLQTLEDQLYILGKQAHKLYDAKDHFEYVVTDAPLFLMLYYMKDANKKFVDGTRWKETLADLVIQTFDQYDNYTYFVDRGDREFRQMGRIHNFQQSVQIDGELRKIASTNGIPYTQINNWNDVVSDLVQQKILEAA